MITVEATLEKLDTTGAIGFELLGYDFMVDESLKVNLIEVNTNPCIDTLSHQQSVFINKLISDTFLYSWKLNLD